jgi:hypothetical protein
MLPGVGRGSDADAATQGGSGGPEPKPAGRIIRACVNDSAYASAISVRAPAIRSPNTATL